MKIQKISNSGIAFTLDDLSNPYYYCPANFYAYNGGEHIFLCDGYFGPEILDKVVKHLTNEFGKKPFVLFNSHWHWDHLRGNTFFENATIIGHKLTKKLILENKEERAKINPKYMHRKVILPNLTFEKEYTEFKEEYITFFHSPGHSEDSSACYDSKNHVLFAGDNVEYPVPYVTSSDLSTYLSTLKKYLKYPTKVVIPSHGYVTDKTLIEANLRYLESFPEIKADMYTDETKESVLKATLQNLATIGEDYIIKDDFENALIYYEKIFMIDEKESMLSKEKIKSLKIRLNEIKEKLK
jgi:glyoxylase-like metal-dependent hydrolase (beta-lactamase superfamily II)